MVFARTSMTGKEMYEGYKADIPSEIMEKMGSGFVLTDKEREIVRHHGKVYVLSYIKRKNGELIKPQLRDLPKGSKSMRLVAIPRLNEVRINGRVTTYFKKFDGKSYSFNSSHYSRKDAMEFMKRRKELTGYDNRIVKFADRYLVYTGR